MTMASDKERTLRRVYVLPTELVDRISAYQEEMGLPSEVEAARRLLDIALQVRDTVETLLEKIRSRFEQERDLRMIAREVLSSHALVRSIEFDKSGNLLFQIEGNSVTGAIDRQGQTFLVRNGQGGIPEWRPFPISAASK